MRLRNRKKLDLLSFVLVSHFPLFFLLLLKRKKYENPLFSWTSVLWNYIHMSLVLLSRNETVLTGIFFKHLCVMWIWIFIFFEWINSTLFPNPVHTKRRKRDCLGRKNTSTDWFFPILYLGNFHSNGDRSWSGCVRSEW